LPIDHFHNDSQYAPHSYGMFNNRYWFDASNYKDGGPVIVLQSGETDGVSRLPYLQKGIVAQLAQATHGIGVILEHRYYGESWPTADLSTPNLRFLTTDQALADQAYFAQHVVFPGLEDKTLTAPNVAYFAYGGSYAGAFVAFLRKLYPDVYWGAISSSGVTEAIYDYWEYYEPIRQYGPPACISATQKIVNVVDNILIGKNDTKLTRELKTAFGLQNVTYDDDFANVLIDGVSGWQSLNWDPAVSDPTFYEYCDNITAPDVLYPSTAALMPIAQSLIATGGWANESANLTTSMLNFIGWLNNTVIAPCAAGGSTQDQCFGQHNATSYTQDDISQTWRSWPYQYCAQWGFLQTGSGAPANQLPLISRTLTLEYKSIICRDAFNITTPPDTEAVNKYGGFNIAYDRLAIVNGEVDPWRPATPASPQAPNPNRKSTVDMPFVVISEAIHHWVSNFIPETCSRAFLTGALGREWALPERDYCNTSTSACS
jgi:hypothetical protein